MIKLNDHLSLSIGKRTVVGCVIGIDQYLLENFSSKKLYWPSYTLISKSKGKFSRYWVTNWEKAGWIVWLQAKTKKIPSDKKIDFSRSGVVSIKFTGDQGQSTPHAAMIVYKMKNKFFGVERFAKSEVMYFEGQRILKPGVVLRS